MSGKDPVKAYFKLKIDMPTGNADLEKNFIDFFETRKQTLPTS